MAAKHGDIAISDTIRRILRMGADLVEGDGAQPTDLSFFLSGASFTGARSMAFALISRPDVNLGDRDLIDILKYPLCIGELRKLVLSRLSKDLKPNKPYDSVWSMLKDIEVRSPDLYQFAKAPPISAKGGNY
jgi:hypothetical protein